MFDGGVVVVGGRRMRVVYIYFSDNGMHPINRGYQANAPSLNCALVGPSPLPSKSDEKINGDKQSSYGPTNVSCALLSHQYSHSTPSWAAVAGVFIFLPSARSEFFSCIPREGLKTGALFCTRDCFSFLLRIWRCHPAILRTIDL